MNKDDKDIRQVWELLMKGALILVCIAFFLGGCTFFNQQFKLQDDHALEEFAEDLLESHLGLPSETVDFTPGDDG